MAFSYAAFSLAAFSRGLNFPSERGDTNQGNFLPGLFNYSTYDVARVRRAGFNAIRVGLNAETALHKPRGLQAQELSLS